VAGITLEGVSKVFGGDVVAVDDVSLEIGGSEFLVLVGPSGCGKSTLLRMIAGLEAVTEGAIMIDGRDVTDLPPGDRDVAMVFQSYALYPHMTVRENLGFGLRVRKTPKANTKQRVDEGAELLGLTEFLERKPAALSGGQRQRVAMGRAIVREPKAFLMDEPLSNLDAKLRVSMRAQLASLHARLGTTTIYVTHDQVEAMTLGQRVAVLHDGQIQQVDTPQTLYARPDNLFVAAFIGSPAMNFAEAKVAHGLLEFAGFRLPILDGTFPQLANGRVVVGIRPETFEDAAYADPSVPRLEVDVAVVEELGAETHVIFPVDNGNLDVSGAPGVDQEEAMLGETRPLFTARVDPRTSARAGSPLRLAVDPSRFHYFDAGTGARLAIAPSVARG
jgi:multiple sugar transport system ATP-binding protein